MTTTEVFPATRAVMFKPGFRGILTMGGVEVWCCNHVHPTHDGAQKCADNAMDGWRQWQERAG